MNAFRLSRLAVALSIGLTPLMSTAQNSSLGQPVQVQDVLTFEAGADLATHSNIFLVDSDVTDAAFRATYGDTARGDTVVSGRFGVKFDRDFSLQRVTLYGLLSPKKYVNYSQFDNIGYGAGANLDWAIGRPWFGKLGVKFGQALSSFADVQQSEKNLQRSSNAYLSAGLRMTPNWSLLAGVDLSYLRNSTRAQEASDYRFLSTEFGVRFAPGTGTELDFVFRNTDGNYPNRQVVDSVGQPLLLTNPNGVDNGFKETALLARLQYKPSEETTVVGQIGYNKRSFDNFSSRDFSGPTARINLDWRPGGLFFMGVDLIRDISSEQLITANYVDLTELGLRPSLRLTGKTSLLGTLRLQRRDYGGDPGCAAGSAPVRKDTVTIFGLMANWQYSRNVLINLGFERQSRSSNYNNLDYTNNVLTLGGRISL